MSDILDLNFYILGDDPHLVFPIKIAKSETVGGLKKANKVETKQDATAHTLYLWKVYKSIFVNCSLKEKLNKLNFVNEESLLPMDKLQEVFSESPVPKYLHIIVRVPPAVTQSNLPSEPQLDLNCFILGDDISAGRVFPVEIAKPEMVGTLKKEIKKEKKPEFNDYVADCLDLWKVKIDLATENSLNVIKVEGDIAGEALKPHVRLAKAFKDLLEDEHLHIIVQCPAKCSTPRPTCPPSYYSPSSLLNCRNEWAENHPKKAPCNSGKPRDFVTDQKKGDLAFYFNRPPAAAATISITVSSYIGLMSGRL